MQCLICYFCFSPKSYLHKSCGNLYIILSGIEYGIRMQVFVIGVYGLKNIQLLFCLKRKHIKIINTKLQYIKLSLQKLNKSVHYVLCTINLCIAIATLLILVYPVSKPNNLLEHEKSFTQFLQPQIKKGNSNSRDNRLAPNTPQD